MTSRRIAMLLSRVYLPRMTILRTTPPHAIAIRPSALAQSCAQRLQNRQYTTPPQTTKVYDFEAVRALSRNPTPDRILIDVREPAEFAAGAIPNAINLPIKSCPDALTLSDEEFEDRFGFAKPGVEQEVVFYCKSGIRSASAAQVAMGAGYLKAGEYRGSWVDWEKRVKGVKGG